MLFGQTSDPNSQELVPMVTTILVIKDFIAIEICQHASFYILNDLSPSPCLEMKFNTQVLQQVVDQINGNDFIVTTLSQNSIGSRQPHAMFKAFSSIQNPLVDSPPRVKYPNWKVFLLLAWKNLILPTAWLLGIKVAIDKITMGFQRMHIEKRQTIYKGRK